MFPSCMIITLQGSFFFFLQSCQAADLQSIYANIIAGGAKAIAYKSIATKEKVASGDYAVIDKSSLLAKAQALDPERLTISSNTLGKIQLALAVQKCKQSTD
jgi:hypothetical protein